MSNICNEVIIVDYNIKGMDIETFGRTWPYSPEERQDPLNHIERIKIWLKNSEEKQAAKPKWEDPCITAADIRKHKKEMIDSVNKVMSKKLFFITLVTYSLFIINRILSIIAII